MSEHEEKPESESGDGVVRSHVDTGRPGSEFETREMPAVPDPAEEDTDDDEPEVIRHRLETYHEKTKPLVDFYEERGVLRRVDGELEPEEVGNRIRALLATLRMEEEL